MGWMRRIFRVPARWTGKRMVLHFDAVAGDCEVRVNGHAAGHHFDSFLPFDFDVTGLISRSGPNELLVGVRAANLLNKRSARYAKFLKPYPDGSSLDGITGIWQDVTLLALPPVHVTDLAGCHSARPFPGSCNGFFHRAASRPKHFKSAGDGPQ